MEKRIAVEDLAVGMFVAELDRPWLDTPFLLQGFLIESTEQIETLRQYCSHVYVDPLRSVGSQGLHVLGQDVEGPPPRRPDWLAEDVNAPDWTLVEYRDEVPMEAELPRAREAIVETEQVVADLFQKLQVSGEADVGETTQVMGTMVDSVVRNPDALTLLARIRRKSEYVYEHALNCSIYALAFGRHLGFDKPELLQLGLGGLMLDAGAARVPTELLARPGPLNDVEYAAVKRHVKYGVEIITGRWALNGLAVDMVHGHHEREDGSGYPRQLKGKRIPVVAKMAAIIDCFDALTSARPYARVHSPYEALQMLFEWSKRTLNPALVEEFIQCLGIYPVGSLVELNSSEVGLVIAHNRVRRLKPRILILLDRDKQAYASPVMLDMLQEPTLPNGIPYAITHALEDGMYGINPRDYYL